MLLPDSSIFQVESEIRPLELFFEDHLASQYLHTSLNMPHTSAKKRQGPRRRMQITDDSGWTHISKGTIKQKHQLHSTTWPDRNEKLLPTAIPQGLTLRSVSSSFDRYTKLWKDSPCLKNLKTIIQDNILASDIEITNCVCLGLGSFAGGTFPETSFFELAALDTVLELLRQKHDINQVYMQEPVYNTLDEDFLRSLGYQIVPSPEGFEKVNKTSFLFAPHLEWPIYLTALQNALPSLCIGNSMQGYLESPTERTSSEARIVFQDSVDRYSSRAMPDFDRSSWCESTAIYWREPVEVDDDSDP